MTRTARKMSSTGIHHVIIRGINRQQIFEEQADYEKFLAILAEVKEISGCKLFAYCLMGNHLHVLVKEGGESISEVFRRIGARYVVWFNRKYGRIGHLFQDRFKSEPVETDEYLLHLLSYIYRNPVEAGICQEPEEYDWSSRKYLGKGGLEDEAELFEIVPLKVILEYEGGGSGKVDLPGVKTSRRIALSDNEVFDSLKKLSGAENTTAFQGLDKGTQREVFVQLREQGASIRQLARLSGYGKGLVEYRCREVKQNKS